LKKSNSGIWFFTEGKFSFLSPNQIKETFGVDYLTSQYFLKEEDCHLVRKKSLESLGDATLTSEASQLGVKFSKELSKGIVNDIYIKKHSLSIGWGAYARKSLGAGDFLGEYTGNVRKKVRPFFDGNDYCFSYPELSLFFMQYTIDAKLAGNEMRFINHSDNPNCEAALVFHEEFIKVVFIALMKIEKDEHLTISYGKPYWSSKEKEDL
jgi:hypothetical protein